MRLVTTRGPVGWRACEENRFVESGSPEKSWLLHKLSGDFSGINCAIVDCKTTMPLGGAEPTAQEVETVRAWIAAGATGQ